MTSGEHVGHDDVVIGGAADLDGARGPAAGAGLPGRRIFSMLVARLPSPARGAAVGPIAVTDSSAGCDIGCDIGGCRVGAAGLDGYAGPPL